jgi:predicted dehydrogenase
MSRSILKMGMVGGGRDAFIGAVHRTAACMDGRVRFVAGALSSSPDKALASGKDLGLDDRRNYPTWRAMLENELSLLPAERIDFVSIVTPNHLHFDVAHAFAGAGFNVVCDKPLVHTSQQAEQLVRAAQRSGVVFAVTYNYSGYPMVKQARCMIRDGALGAVRKVIVEYNQGWLATRLEGAGQKQADWRTDPARSGLGGAIGDIGSHAEQLVSYITGLEIDAICADLTTFVSGRRLDDDANLLVRFVERDGVAARGLLIASQISVGCENDLAIRIFGEKGALHWRQEEPNHLVFHPLGEPERVFRRGNDYLAPAAKSGTRLPSGHPEAFLEAFANVYNAAGDAIRARTDGRTPGAVEFDHPSLVDGARGVRFIEKTVESSANERKWTSFRA